MSAKTHAYRDGTHGRSMTSRPGNGGLVFHAYLQCSRCPTKGEVPTRGGIDPPQIDRRFINLGWRVDPHVCPACAAKPKEKPMTATQSIAAMKATIQMNDLLQAHFDVKNGRYVTGWSDEKIAKDTGLGLKSVADYRIAEFGEIREPTEIALIRQDVNALEKLQQETNATFTGEIATLRARLADACKTMGLRA